ncbi:MAG: hypothetical protein JWM56_1004 [Candidatus Peribacteria bacterium]|nr:hypothetical protein [Candidatus Peribacteria bacterium]
MTIHHTLNDLSSDAGTGEPACAACWNYADRIILDNTEPFSFDIDIFRTNMQRFLERHDIYTQLNIRPADTTKQVLDVRKSASAANDKEQNRELSLSVFRLIRSYIEDNRYGHVVRLIIRHGEVDIRQPH